MHGRSFEGCGWHARWARRLPDRLRDGLRRRIPAVESGKRGRLLLELLRRQHFRHHPYPDADWRWHAVFPRSKRARMAAYRRRRVVHLSWGDREHAHLFSTHDSLQHSGDAGPTGGWTRADRASDPATWREFGRVTGSRNLEDRRLPTLAHPAFSNTIVWQLPPVHQ